MPQPESKPQASQSQLKPPVERLTDLRSLFKLASDKGASDIHLTEFTAPVLRIHGSLQPTDMEPLTRADTKRLIYSILTDNQRALFEKNHELDMSVEVSGLGRFRVNVHMQRGSVEAAFRLVPANVTALDELGLPPVVAELTRKSNGLVLVTGPTGVGKTTTLASMVDQINRERNQLIIVIEDPIEYMHHNRKSVIKQREVYSDTHSFSNALVHAMRQDPDVIVVGEMRDLETMSTALTAAETGHLVLATLHTPDATQTIDRILDVFPAQQQQQVKVQLADCLQAVISQQLLPRSDSPGRVLAYEIMVATPAVRALIREHATEQLMTVLQTGRQYGMCTMDAKIKELYDQGFISMETAMTRVKNPVEFQLLGSTQPKKQKSGWMRR